MPELKPDQYEQLRVKVAELKAQWAAFKMLPTEEQERICREREMVFLQKMGWGQGIIKLPFPYGRPISDSLAAV